MSTFRRKWHRAKFKARRWVDLRRAPWPVVGECHQNYRPDHTCPQCDGSHDHQWVTWATAPRWITGGPGLPVRCRVCGGRKCDARDCNGQRHFHKHAEGVMAETRKTTVSVNLRERAAAIDIQAVVTERVRPWFDAIEAEGLTWTPPTFELVPDVMDPWTTHIRVTTTTTRTDEEH